MKHTFTWITTFVTAVGLLSLLASFLGTRPLMSQGPPPSGTAGNSDPCQSVPTGNAFGREEHLCPPQGNSAGIAKGDFNGDGYADLAIGTPNDVINGVASGSVNIVYGARSGAGLDAGSLADPKPQLFYGGEIFYSGTSVFEIPGGAVAGAGFGAALAAGDFNGDGYTDLAIGEPGWNGNNGAVVVLYGGPNGLRFDHTELITEYCASGPNLSGCQPQNQNLVPGQINGGPNGDRFGASLAWGHFSDTAFQQKYADLAIGIPGKWVVNNAGAILENAGAVLVINGGYYGLSAGAFAPFNTVQGPTTQYFDLSVSGMASNGGAAAFNRFGSALTGGDFNHDGYTDLAAGIPFRSVTRSDGTVATSAGAVTVLYGGRATLSGSICFIGCGTGTTSVIGVSGNQFITQLTFNVCTVSDLGQYTSQPPANTNDRFGSAVAAGDLNLDGYEDLVVGIPGATVNGLSQAGAIRVVYGSFLGPSCGQLYSQYINQSDTRVNPSAAGDWFGFSLAINDFNGDGIKDLAIGAPNKTLRDYVSEGLCVCFVDHRSAGAVTVLYGNHGPGVGGIFGSNNPYVPLEQLPAAGPQFLFQGGNTAQTEPRYQYSGNQFGYSLTAWKFDGDTYADLAIGVPGDSLQPAGDFPSCGCAIGGTVPSISQAGAVQVMYGSISGFSLSSSRNQKFHQTVTAFAAKGFNLPGIAQPNDQFGRTVY